MNQAIDRQRFNPWALQYVERDRSLKVNVPKSTSNKVLPKIAANMPLIKVQVPPTMAKPEITEPSKYSCSTCISGCVWMVIRNIAVLLSTGSGGDESGIRARALTIAN